MIITPHMVLLNYPRTGSTWARGVLRRLHGVEGRTLAQRLAGTRLGWRGFHELTLPIDRTTTALREGRRSQHGSYRQIPSWAARAAPCALRSRPQPLPRRAVRSGRGRGAGRRRRHRAG